MKHEYVLPDKFLSQIFVAKIRCESVNFYLATLKALKQRTAASLMLRPKVYKIALQSNIRKDEFTI
jgi:hypothetical protein